MSSFKKICIFILVCILIALTLNILPGKIIIKRSNWFSHHLFKNRIYPSEFARSLNYNILLICQICGLQNKDKIFSMNGNLTKFSLITFCLNHSKKLIPLIIYYSSLLFLSQGPEVILAILKRNNFRVC